MLIKKMDVSNRYCKCIDKFVIKPSPFNENSEPIEIEVGEILSIYNISDKRITLKGYKTGGIRYYEIESSLQFFIEHFTLID